MMPPGSSFRGPRPDTATKTRSDGMGSLHSFDNPFAEQALRTEDEEQKGQNIGEPILRRPADQRADGELEQFLPHPDDQTADDGARDRGEAPSIRTGKAFRAMSDSENCTPDLVPHMIPATRATKPAIDQTSTQM